MIQDLESSKAHGPPTPQDTRDPGHRPGLDRRLAGRFLEIARPYWVSEHRWRARGLLALLMLLLLGQTTFNVLFNQESGEFTSALAAGDGDRFWSSIRRCLAILVIAVPIWAFYYYVRDTLALTWRRWLTDDFLKRYFSHHAFYALNASADIDNPDQRMSEDINTFTQQSLYFLMVALGAVIQLVAFTGVLWSISRELVYFLVGYAIAGTLIAAFGFGRPLIGLNYRQLHREADFRFGLVRVREHAEAIALEAGEAQELGGVRRYFDAVFRNYRRILRWQLNLNLFQYGFSFLTIVLPSAIIAGDVLSGRLEVGRAIQAAGAFTAILGALTVIVDHFESLSRFAAGVDRLHGFAAALQARIDARPDVETAITASADARIALAHLTVLTPDRERLLVRDLSLEIAPGDGLMIVGASGGGKSSLLRVMAGLWTSGSGRIIRPSGPDIAFLPQQPYMAFGSLRSQLLYPNGEREISDAELMQLLARVNLPDMGIRFGGLDAERDWSKVLSVGEQQRLAFARILLNRPRYVMLDEATSALDAQNEAILYRQLATEAITPVSVSHHPSLLPFHAKVLELTGGGDWRMHAAADYRFVVPR